MQQAEPERGPLLAAVARVVPVPKLHTHTGDRREEWHRSDCPSAHSTDTSTGQQSFWTKPELFFFFFWYLLYLYKKVALTKKTHKQKRGKKHGAAQKRKLIDFAGQQIPAFSVSETSEEAKRIYSN